MKLNLIKVLAVGVGAVALTLIIGCFAGIALDAIGVQSTLIKAVIGFMIGYTLPGRIIKYVLKEELEELASESQKEE